MAGTIRRRWIRAAGALLLIACAARAEASGAQLRWTASSDPRVLGYHVYMRTAGHPYGSPIDAGHPAAQSDGSVSYTVSGLSTSQTYYFAVTSYGTPPLESGLSRELPLGKPNPCMVDRCSSLTACDIRAAADGSSCDDGLFCNGIAVCQGGTCHNGPAPACDDGVACTTDSCDETNARCLHTARPGCCTSDADCIDNDACTRDESCVNGSCVSSPDICPDSPCASSFCDPVAGCGLFPTPDGITCEACGDFAPRKILIGSSSSKGSINLRGTFVTDATLDPSSAGFSVEIDNGVGALLYKATVPAAWVLSKRNGTKFSFRAKDNQLPTTNGISSILLRKRGDTWALTVRGSADDLTAAVGPPQLIATLSFGPVCMKDPELICVAQTARAICR